MRYRNKMTGNEIVTNGVVSSPDYEEIKPMAEPITQKTSRPVKKSESKRTKK